MFKRRSLYRLKASQCDFVKEETIMIKEQRSLTKWKNFIITKFEVKITQPRVRVGETLRFKLSLGSWRQALRTSDSRPGFSWTHLFPGLELSQTFKQGIPSCYVTGQCWTLLISAGPNNKFQNFVHHPVLYNRLLSSQRFKNVILPFGCQWLIILPQLVLNYHSDKRAFREYWFEKENLYS